jgi:histone deacetylase 1/2
MRNVSRTWAFETGLAAGVELASGNFDHDLGVVSTDEIDIDTSDIPENEYYEYFGPEYKLDVKSSNVEDFNTRPYLDRVRNVIFENLRHIGGPPSVQMTGSSLSSP